MDQDQKITILDGGFTTVLERKGFSLENDPLWSSRFLYTNPSLVAEVHKSYLESGSDIITTSSYQASIPGFQKYLKLTQEESENLIKLSAYLAQQARKEHLEKTGSDKGKNIMIAGSVGPYGAAQADGSEYTGSYIKKVSSEELIEWHRPRLQCLVDAGVDIIAFETIPAAEEGIALMKLLRDFPGVKAWLSFSCQSLHQTACGENLVDVANKCMKAEPPGQLIALGVNCCPPDYVSTLLKDISIGACGVPLICYPNSGETWDYKTGWMNDKSKPISEYIENWIQVPVKYVGGCCRTGPDDIAAIVHKLRTS